MKTYHMPPYVSFALVAQFLLGLLYALKYFQQNQSKYYQTRSKAEYPLIFCIQFGELCACSLVHMALLYTLSYKSHHRKYCPSVVVNALFAGVYIYAVVICVMDLETTYDMNNNLSEDHIHAYIIHQKPKYEITVVKEGLDIKHNMARIASVLANSKRTHIILLVCCFAVVACCIAPWAVLNMRLFFESLLSSQAAISKFR